LPLCTQFVVPKIRPTCVAGVKIPGYAFLECLYLGLAFDMVVIFPFQAYFELAGSKTYPLWDEEIDVHRNYNPSVGNDAIFLGQLPRRAACYWQARPQPVLYCAVQILEVLSTCLYLGLVQRRCCAAASAVQHDRLLCLYWSCEQLRLLCLFKSRYY